jgi:hypothetical protein
MSPQLAPSVLFPPSLKMHMGHATRFAKVLDELSAKGSTDEFSFRWVMGRGDEVRVFVADVVGDLQRGAIEGALAGKLVARYLFDLHLGLREALRRSAMLPCCMRLSAGEPASTDRAVLRNVALRGAR